MERPDNSDNWWEIVTVRSRLRIVLNPDDVVEIRSPEGTLAYLSRVEKPSKPDDAPPGS